MSNNEHSWREGLQIWNSTLGHSTEWLLEVARGNVAGASFDRKFGAIDSIQADTPADVWQYGVVSGAERYTFSSTDDIDTISSSSTSDTIDMTIIGLDGDGLEVTQTATLDGTNKVTLGTSLWRVNRMYNSNGTNLVGSTYCYVNGSTTAGVPDSATNVRAFVNPNDQQTLQSVYTVPAGKTAYFMGLEASLTKGIGATGVNGIFTGKTRADGGVFRTQDQFVLLSNGKSKEANNFPIPLPFNEKTDFCPVVDVSANNLGASWAFTVLLLDN